MFSSRFTRNGYDKNASTTSRDLGLYEKMEYLGGTTNGDAMSDMFHIGDVSWNQTFIAANETSWAVLPGDGFLGMGFSYIAEPQTETIVETMMQEGMLNEPKFAIYYGKEFNYTGDGPGEGILTLGSSKEKKYVEGDMTWIQVHKDDVDNTTAYQLWRSHLRKISGQRHGDAVSPPANGTFVFPDNAPTAVFDTGAGMISLPSTSVVDVYKAIGWNFKALLDHSYIPLCADFNSTWSVTFTFSENNVDFFDVSIRGDQLGGNRGYANRQDACVPPFDDSGNARLALMGQNFVRAFYTVFDFGGSKVQDFKPRIGFGQLKAEYQAPVPI